FAVDFSRARQARRRRYREVQAQIRLGQQPAQERGFAAAAGTRQDDQWPFGHQGLYSTFCTSSRIFSSVPLISTTCREISTSLALEPIVFASRNISWVRNSSFRPGLSGSFMISRNWSR